LSFAPDGMTPLAGQSILITGATGSFGRAFTKRALHDGARRVVIFSRDEAKQAAMRNELADPRLRFFIGDVRNAQRVTEAMRNVDIVIHAAAMKRVETCEADPSEAKLTNVDGTENVARACITNGVGRAVFLSTDKAADPITTYGYTKALAERLWNGWNVYSAGTRTRFSATRYGNVMGSTGSVLPLWRAQAERGEPLTVTHPAMSRFWMRMEEAVELVILALTEMRGGEVFVPRIGASRILDLAEAVAPGSPTRTIGLRAVEKIHETLLTENESRTAYDCGGYFVIEPESRSWGELPPLDHPRVELGFSFRSDTADPIPVEDMVRAA
jgi:UDP-N-acetylglucosamine 4,6-dehydratase